VYAPTEDKTDDAKESFLRNQFPKYHMKVFLAHVNVKVGREGIFKSTVRNERLHKISNNNGVIIVNFAIAKKI
jgi:hypothetical protein